MTLASLVEELTNILKVHPEAKDATIWAEAESMNGRERMGYVRLETKRKVMRIVLGEGL